MMKSSKQKIDEALGIQDGMSVDAFLDQMQIDTEELSSSFEKVSDDVKQNIAQIDQKLNDLSHSTDLSASQLALKDVTASMAEVEDLILTSKKMFKHIYEGIVTTDLIDSELVGAAAKMLEAIHINIKEFIDLYKEKQRYVDKVKLMIFQQEQRKEMEELKHKLAMERMKMKNDQSIPEAEAGMVSYNVADIVKSLNAEFVDIDIVPETLGAAEMTK